jgi:hypothetical protein
VDARVAFFLDPLPCLTRGTEVLLRGMLVLGNRAKLGLTVVKALLVIIATGEEN